MAMNIMNRPVFCFRTLSLMASRALKKDEENFLGLVWFYDTDLCIRILMKVRICKD